MQELTDYPQFERLCSDVMAGQGYQNIEPLGGSSDGGRDAIFVSRTAPKNITLFAYSVRQDWARKLNEDCARIHEKGHECCTVVFVCTAAINTSDKDAAKQRIKQDYGWQLEIHDLERLRISLVGPLRHLIPKHPHIFCTPWFPVRGGLSIAHGRDTIVIDHVLMDHAFATWLARKLQLGGYSTWCLGTAPMAGETPDETVRLLIENRAIRYLPILSANSIEDPDLVARCTLAGNTDGLFLPCIVGACNTDRLGNRLKSILPIRFDAGWATGLRDLVKSFNVQNIAKQAVPKQLPLVPSYLNR